MQHASFDEMQARRYSRRRLLAWGARASLGLGLASGLGACALPSVTGTATPVPPTATPVPIPIRLLSGHSSPVVWVGWRPKKTLLASLGAGDGLRLWNVDTGDTLANVAPTNFFTPASGETVTLNTAAWSPDGSTIALGFGSTRRGGIRLWDVESKSVRAQIDTPDTVLHVDWSPDSKQIISTSYASLSIWQASDGSSVRQFQVEGHGGYPAWSPDGKTLAVVTYSGGVALVDAISGKASTTYRGVGNGATAVVWSHRGVYLAALANVIFVYQPQAQNQAALTFDVGFAANALVWSPDDAYLAAARYPVNIVQVSSQSIAATLGDRHEPELLAVDWSSDGKRLATGGADGKLHLYAVNSF
jgi:WD40 repeat protein